MPVASVSMHDLYIAWGVGAVIVGIVVLRYRRALARSDIDRQVTGLRANPMLDPQKRAAFADVLGSRASRRLQVWITTGFGIGMLVAGVLALVSQLG